MVGGAVVSRLVRSTPEPAVRVRALARDIVLCSWARHFTLTVPLSTQVYKWVPANCWGNLTNCGEVTCDGLASRPGDGSRNTSSRFVLQKLIFPTSGCWNVYYCILLIWCRCGQPPLLCLMDNRVWQICSCLC